MILIVTRIAGHDIDSRGRVDSRLGSDTGITSVGLLRRDIVHALIVVLVAVDPHIHTVLVQQRLDAVLVSAVGLLDAGAHLGGVGVAVGVAGAVRTAVRMHDDPRRSSAIRLCEIII